jgi:hypothetical protein
MPNFTIRLLEPILHVFTSPSTAPLLPMPVYCKYFDQCRRIACWDIHPTGRSIDARIRPNTAHFPPLPPFTHHTITPRRPPRYPAPTKERWVRVSKPIPPTRRPRSSHTQAHIHPHAASSSSSTSLPLHSTLPTLQPSFSSVHSSFSPTSSRRFPSRFRLPLPSSHTRSRTTTPLTSSAPHTTHLTHYTHLPQGLFSSLNFDTTSWQNMSVG